MPTAAARRGATRFKLGWFRETSRRTEQSCRTRDGEEGGGVRGSGGTDGRTDRETDRQEEEPEESAAGRETV